MLVFPYEPISVFENEKCDFGETLADDSNKNINQNTDVYGNNKKKHIFSSVKQL